MKNNGMLPHERLPFSGIDERLPLHFPWGIRTVVWPVLALEVWDISRPMALIRDDHTPMDYDKAVGVGRGEEGIEVQVCAIVREGKRGTIGERGGQPRPAREHWGYRPTGRSRARAEIPSD